MRPAFFTFFEHGDVLRSVAQHREPDKSYISNRAKELQCLDFVRNFERQFRVLYSGRRPLFLIAPNEYGVDKFVSTTVRPTLLPYKDLYEHQHASAFVADFLTYEFLDSPLETPKALPSPTSVMWQQKGNCFDYAVLLCSLLEGAGYDAYCIYGYAAKHVCLMDHSRHTTVTEETAAAPPVAPPAAKKNKYALQPRPRLESAFDQETPRRQAATSDAAATATPAMPSGPDAKTSTSAVADPVHGLRVHCWLLLRAGKRGIPADFFIEPTTGQAVSVTCADYLGIEAAFNSKNYWVNMQDCNRGLTHLRYDLGDSSRWEYVFPQLELPITSIDTVITDLEAGERPEDRVLDMPPSWVNKLSLAPQVQHRNEREKGA